MKEPNIKVDYVDISRWLMNNQNTRLFVDFIYKYIKIYKFEKYKNNN